mmetsp:Transcript_12683/g.21349  ORF Transcript_12683/g.21349 Transcript_12683/m.21349 type:complete len:277 (+) Transcript_12683:2140-2970(+)
MIGGDDIVLAKVHPSQASGQAQLGGNGPRMPLVEEFKSYDSYNSVSAPPPYELAIVKRYDFEASLQRMSVIVKNSVDKSFRAYVKGSPEKIEDLCHASSIPTNYHQELEEYTKQGYRVIALAYRVLDKMSFLQIQSTSRDSIEKDLFFLGLLVMENRLKTATTPTIQTLNQCRVRTIMATGDNTLTAISVARQCNILALHQDVYFGDVEGDKIVWKKTTAETEEELEALEGQTSHVPSQRDPLAHDSSKTVPWEEENAKDFGVALNGKTLDFLHSN